MATEFFYGRVEDLTVGSFVETTLTNNSGGTFTVTVKLDTDSNLSDLDYLNCLLVGEKTTGGKMNIMFYFFAHNDSIIWYDDFQNLYLPVENVEENKVILISVTTTVISNVYFIKLKKKPTII